MSLAGVLSSLDQEISELQASIDANQPEKSYDTFLRLRVLSIGRTFLRTFPAGSEPSWQDADAAYKALRKKILS